MKIREVVPSAYATEFVVGAAHDHDLIVLSGAIKDLRNADLFCVEPPVCS